MLQTFATRRFFVLLGLLISPFIFVSPVQARYAALVVEADSGKVLYARNAQQQRYPASLTKMMTLYMVFDALKRGRLTLNHRLPVSSRAVAQPPSKLGLRKGETITVRQAILALVTRSANDVATVVAEGLGRTEANFARLMTRKARSLGMEHTTFRNASGLPNNQQVTTAWDMLRLAKALQRDFPQYYHYFSTKDFTFRGKRHRNHNRLLDSYEGTNGIKTGYIRASGFNLVASVNRAGRRVIGIVFGGKTGWARDAHMRDILDQGFERLLASAPVQGPKYSEAKNSSVSTDSSVVEQGSADSLQKVNADKSYRTLQVGVFSRLAAAEKQASTAIKALPNLRLLSQKTIDQVSRSGKTLYYTRFKNLSGLEAEAACQALRRKQIDCFTLSPDG